MKDREPPLTPYRMAVFGQKLKAVVAEESKPHLGPADERCPACGELIETLLNSEGQNPLRQCWRCAVEEEDQRPW